MFAAAATAAGAVSLPGYLCSPAVRILAQLACYVLFVLKHEDRKFVENALGRKEEMKVKKKEPRHFIMTKLPDALPYIHT